jgi:hypothetical protein
MKVACEFGVTLFLIRPSAELLTLAERNGALLVSPSLIGKLRRRAAEPEYSSPTEKKAV